MTIVPIKERIENIINIPQSLPNRIVRILAQNADERSWEDVEQLQKSTWQLTDHLNRQKIDAEVSKSYEARYGNGMAKLDATGKIINRELDWNPKKNNHSDKVAQIGLKLRNLARSELNENLFRGLERGINIIQGKKSKHVKVCGVFDENAQQLLTGIINYTPLPNIMKALKTGLVTDCYLGFQNRNLTGEEKKGKLAEILKIFNNENEEEDENESESESEAVGFENENDYSQATEHTKTAADAPQPEIKGFIWHSQDACGDCGQYNGKIFEPEDLPTPHPNCLCTIEEVIENKPYMRIYVKDNAIGHVRIEIVDAQGVRTIRGLNNTWKGANKGTEYEKGEKDSGGKSVDSKEYLPSQKILLTQEEYDKAHQRIEELDKKNPLYSATLYNCDDFINDIIHSSGLDKGLDQYLTDEQKEVFKASIYYDNKKYGEPNYYGATSHSLPDLLDEEERKLIDKYNLK